MTDWTGAKKTGNFFKAAGMLMAALLVSGQVYADGPKAEDVVDYRKGVFNVIGWNFGPMVGMVKGEIPYDAAAFEENARRVKELSIMALEGFESKAMTDDSESKPEIWDNWDDFQAKMEEMNTQVVNLHEVSQKGDLGAIRGIFGDVGGSCKSCHDDYKKD